VVWKEFIKELFKVASEKTITFISDIKNLDAEFTELINKVKEHISDYAKDLINIAFEEVETLTKEDVIEWFKEELERDPELEKYSLLLGDLKKLNPDYKQLVRRKYLDEEKYPYLLIQGFFDEKFNKFVKYRLIAAEYVEDELESLLKDKGLVFFE